MNIALRRSFLLTAERLAKITAPAPEDILAHLEATGKLLSDMTGVPLVVVTLPRKEQPTEGKTI